MQQETAKQRRLRKIKEAKRDFKLAEKHETDEFTKLRNYTFKALLDMAKRKFDCGSLIIKIR